MIAPATEHPPGRERPAVARRDLVVLLVAAACLQAIAWAVLLLLFSGGWMGYGLHQLADTLLYHFYASSFALGRWPYADVPVEYPPLANLVFLLPPSGGAVAEYERWFSAAMIAATTAGRRAHDGHGRARVAVRPARSRGGRRLRRCSRCAAARSP